MSTPTLPAIPVHALEGDWPAALLQVERVRADALLDAAQKQYTRLGLKLGDFFSKAWLKRYRPELAAEINALATQLQRPGVTFLNLSYEWACTACARDSATGPRLYRVLDWPFDGLGRALVCVTGRGPAGPFSALTWPGYAGLIQGLAPGRFGVAINQAPLHCITGLFALDWLLARKRLFANRHIQPAHLLRQVVEEAKDFAEAKAILSQTPLALPVIFTLAGVEKGETVVIERQETQARLLHDAPFATNHWTGFDLQARPRGRRSLARREAIQDRAQDLDFTLSWLTEPILNQDSRLAFVAEPRSGRLLAQALEKDGPASTALALAGGAEKPS